MQTEFNPCLSARYNQDIPQSIKELSHRAGGKQSRHVRLKGTPDLIPHRRSSVFKDRVRKIRSDKKEGTKDSILNPSGDKGE